jgi:hypothetical protein
MAKVGDLIEVVGVSCGDGGRSCTSHEVCGDALQEGMLLKIVLHRAVPDEECMDIVSSITAGLGCEFITISCRKISWVHKSTIPSLVGRHTLQAKLLLKLSQLPLHLIRAFGANLAPGDDKGRELRAV